MAKDLSGLSLRDILPQSIMGDPRIQSMISALDPELRAVTGDAIKALVISRIDDLPEAVLDLLAWQWHVDFYEPTEIPVERKRALVRGSIAWHRKKGTPWAVKKILADLSVEATIHEWYEIGTEPYTFAVEAEFDYARTEPFFINSQTKDLLVRAIELTKPERAHLVYFSFVPVDTGQDADHICVYDDCHFSHGYLWTINLGVIPLDELLRVIPAARADGCAKRLICGSAAYQWSALFDAYRFGDLPFRAVGDRISVILPGLAGFADHGHVHGWHSRRSWLCGGTWLDDCCLRDIAGTVAVFARSTGVFGGDALLGDINNTYSGGVEEIVPYIGSFGEDAFSGLSIDGPYYGSILEFTQRIEVRSSERGFFRVLPEGVIRWES